MTNKGVVLLFGAFNPFTNAHLHIGKLAREQYPDYDIYYVPARINYMLEWKGMNQTDIINEEIRLDMIRGAIGVLAGFYVTDIEIKGVVNGKTYNTIRYFKEELGYDDVVLCMGTDKVDELETWYNGQDLVRDNKFLIITRNGESLDERMTAYTRAYSSNFTEIKNTECSYVSASMIRDAISRGDWKKVEENVPFYVYEKLKKT